MLPILMYIINHINGESGIWLGQHGWEIEILYQDKPLGIY